MKRRSILSFHIHTQRPSQDHQLREAMAYLSPVLIRLKNLRCGVNGRTGCPQPGWRRGVCHPEDFIERIKCPVCSPQSVFLHLDDPAGRIDLDATLCQKPLKLRLHPLVMGWEYRGSATEQQKL